MTVTRILLARHAQPAESSRGLCYGTLDIALAEAGRAAALRLADALAELPLAAVYSSPRRRALETAAPIAARHGFTPVPVDALRELDFGELEGRPYDEIALSQPDLYRRWMTAPTTVTFPGGESYAALRRRAVAATAELRERHRGQAALVVAHGGVVRAVLADALGMPDAAIFRLGQDYCGTSVVAWYDGTPVVERVNIPPEGL